MKTQISILFFFLIFISFEACKKETKCVDGNGDIIQESRVPGNFNNVEFNGSYLVTLHMRPDTDVDLFGESNIIPLIQTTVSNETLVVGVQDDACYNTNNTVEVSVSNPTFSVVTFNGSGDIKSNNLVGNDLTVYLNGTGNFESGLVQDIFGLHISGAGSASLIGTGNEGMFTISGTGNIYATNFEQDSVYVTISGSGDVRLLVYKYLDVTITGSGNVYYDGDPETVKTNITGTGVVEPI